MDTGKQKDGRRRLEKTARLHLVLRWSERGPCSAVPVYEGLDLSFKEPRSHSTAVGGF